MAESRMFKINLEYLGVPENTLLSENERANSERQQVPIEEIPNDKIWVVLSIKINNGCNVLQLTE